MKYLISIFTLIIFIQFSYSDEIINCSTCGNIINKEYSYQFKKLFNKKNNLNIKIEKLSNFEICEKATKIVGKNKFIWDLNQKEYIKEAKKRILSCHVTLDQNIKESLTSSSSKQKTTSEDKSIENKLKELNALYKKGLINKEALTNLQIKLLSK